MKPKLVMWPEETLCVCLDAFGEHAHRAPHRCLEKHHGAPCACIAFQIPRVRMRSSVVTPSSRNPYGASLLADPSAVVLPARARVRAPPS